MSSLDIGALGLLALLVCIASGIPVGVSLASVGLAGIFVLKGSVVVLDMLGWQPYHSLALFAFVTLPLFILMGEYAHHTGAATSAFSASYKWLANLTGGLAMAVVSASALFAACTGSSIASAATMAKVCYPEMRKFGYDKGFSAGLVAASGSLAALIPPSVIMVLYCMLTETSLARLLVAGFFPGVLSAIVWMSVIYVMVKLKPSLGPNKEWFPWKERLRALPQIGGIGLIVVFVIGGMYVGIFTASEAAAAGAILTLVMALMKKTLSFSVMRESLHMTCVTTTSIFFIVFGALIFGKYLSLSGITKYAVELITASSLPPLVVFIGIFLLYLFLGCILEAASMLAVTLPLVFPLMVALGYDPIWFGIIVVKMCEMAVITPPVGLNVYAVKGILKEEVSLESLFSNVVPFLIGDVIILTILYIFPQIVLFLPSHFIGS